jgi:hypothetical protein
MKGDRSCLSLFLMERSPIFGLPSPLKFQEIRSFHISAPNALVRQHSNGTPAKTFQDYDCDKDGIACESLR